MRVACVLRACCVGWSKYDNDIVASERDIREATKKMFDEVIPTLARDLDDTDISDFFERVLKEDAVCCPFPFCFLFFCSLFIYYCHIYSDYYFITFNSCSDLMFIFMLTFFQHFGTFF